MDASQDADKTDQSNESRGPTQTPIDIAEEHGIKKKEKRRSEKDPGVKGVRVVRRRKEKGVGRNQR